MAKVMLKTPSISMGNRESGSICHAAHTRPAALSRWLAIPPSQRPGSYRSKSEFVSILNRADYRGAGARAQHRACARARATTNRYQHTESVRRNRPLQGADPSFALGPALTAPAMNSRRLCIALAGPWPGTPAGYASIAQVQAHAQRSLQSLSGGKGVLLLPFCGTRGACVRAAPAG